MRGHTVTWGGQLMNNLPRQFWHQPKPGRMEGLVCLGGEIQASPSQEPGIATGSSSALHATSKVSRHRGEIPEYMLKIEPIIALCIPLLKVERSAAPCSVVPTMETKLKN